MDDADQARANRTVCIGQPNIYTTARACERRRVEISVSSSAAKTAAEAPMASLSFVGSLLTPSNTSSDLVQLCILKYPRSSTIRAISKKNLGHSGVEDSSNGTAVPVEKAPKRTKQAPRRSKKVTSRTSVKNDDPEAISAVQQEKNTETAASSEDAKKVPRRSRKKAAASPAVDGNGTPKKVVRKGTRKKMDSSGEQSDREEFSDNEMTSIINLKDDLQLQEGEEEDISFTDGWPPLVCCFGAAQNFFVPSGRPANRLINHDIHETRKNMLWSPLKFVRAPGGSSSSVAVALAREGGKVAFMGKLGTDAYGAALISHLNFNNVQTQPVKVDSSGLTAVSHMKISRRGGLKLSCIRRSAEDSFLSSEIDIDVLRETISTVGATVDKGSLDHKAKMFYFNSSSLLDESMRSTTMHAIRVSKGFGGVIFFDLNLPIPLWQSKDETMAVVNEAWNSADFIEVTKQELEFLSGIEPSEKFDTKDNDKSKFIHYKPDVIKPLWHENLKVLFVTNGTSKVHYYTETHNDFVLGMEDPPITPFTCEMSVAGDAVVAGQSAHVSGLMRMLTIQPHLATDIEYLAQGIEYAISCGIQHQWLQGRLFGFPPKEKTEEMADGILNSITEKEYRTAGIKPFLYEIFRLGSSPL
ncbi:hypothetical protein ACLOJK_002511 [Asimina triloba]